MLRLLAVVLVISQFHISTYALSTAGYMRPLRNDLSIPEACRDLDVHNFPPSELEYITYGIRGSEDRGFTYEYPMSRSQASVLWKAIKRYLYEGAPVPNFGDRNLQRDFDTMLAHYEEMDFDFKSEGEVLELLAIVKLNETIGDDHFVTGSVSYQADTAGELDLVIGRTSDCQVEVVGEAKLGVRKLGYAKEQLRRFREFIRDYYVSNLSMAAFGLSTGY